MHASVNSGCHDEIAYSLGGLNNKHLFLILLEVERSEIKMLADSVFGKDPLPGL
mgnify:CR=1 FL=1